MRTNTDVVDNAPLNVGQTLPATVVADSDGRGAAFWIYASSNRGVSSNKRREGIRDGDAYTLG